MQRTNTSARKKTHQPQAMVPETRTSKGFTVRGFGALPDDFDPTKATARQLAAYRLPRRPDAETEPELRALWDRTISRTKLWLMPEFMHRENITHGPAQRPKGRSVARAERRMPVVNDDTSTNWSGAVSFAPSDIGIEFSELPQRLLSVGDRLHFPVVPLQRVAHQSAQRGLVLDDEHPPHPFGVHILNARHPGR